MSETIVLYATRSGHSRVLALDLGSRLGAEVREIGDLVNRKGLFGWLRSGGQAAMKKATPISDPALDLGRVSTIVLVQPVWASAICPPIRSWLRAHAKELTGKRIALLTSSMGTSASVLRSAFESEFASDTGKLAACANILQQAGQAERDIAIEEFVSELGRR